MDLPAAVPSDLCLPCHKHCQLSLSAMSTYKSPAKKTRSFKRLLKFIKNKCLEEVQPVLTIAVLPSTSFTPSPTLSFSRTDSIDVPPDVSLSTEMFSPCKSNYLSPSSSTTIPQLDGCAPDIPSPVQCADCHKVFETNEELNNHDETHEFGCEDCNLCFTTKQLCDLHELAKHPGSTYALNYIPYLTKLQFARNYH